MAIFYVFAAVLYMFSIPTFLAMTWLLSIPIPSLTLRILATVFAPISIFVLLVFAIIEGLRARK